MQVFFSQVNNCFVISTNPLPLLEFLWRITNLIFFWEGGKEKKEGRDFLYIKKITTAVSGRRWNYLQGNMLSFQHILCAVRKKKPERLHFVSFISKSLAHTVWVLTVALCQAVCSLHFWEGDLLLESCTDSRCLVQGYAASQLLG